MTGSHGASWQPRAENDFEIPVFARHPELREIKHTLLTRGAQFALLSGSGATVFGVFRRGVHGARVAAAELARTQTQCLCCFNLFRAAQYV